MTTQPQRPGAPADLDRRGFFRVAAATTAAAGIAGSTPASTRQDRRREPLPPPPNHVAPAMQFHAAPEGTGALLAPDARPYPTLDIAPRKDAPGSDAEIAMLPIEHLAGLIRAGELTSVDLTEIYLERIARLDGKLLSVVTPMAEQAREAAAAADAEIAAGKIRGPLHGIPWGAKDLFSTRGVPTTWGARPFADRIIDEDADVVTRLRDAGAVLIAKLSLGTFARGDQWFRGRTRNPWNTARGSSGSSAGPAAATVAGLVGFGIGTETRGSIVSPARRCGMSALRPTFGRVSRHGAMTLSWSMDKVGPMCRTILDCALVFDAIHGADPRDPSTLTMPFAFERDLDLGKVTIGYTRGADEDFLARLQELGARPTRMEDPPSSRRIGNILGAESAAAFADFLKAGLDEKMVHPERVASFRRGADMSAVDYLNAQRHRLELMKAMRDWMGDVRVYVSRTGDLGLTNLTGHPSVVVPCGFDGGQPTTTTLIGQPFADDVLLSVAHAYQKATDWHRRHPDLG